MSIDDLVLGADRVPLGAILRSDFYSFVQAAFPIVSGGEALLLIGISRPWPMR